MSELSPEARQLLDATRSAGGPSAAQRLAMKKAVLSSVAAPAAVVAVKAGLGLKLGVAAVALGMAAAAYVALSPAAEELPERSRGPAPVSELPEPSRGPALVVEAPAPEPEPEPAPVVVAVKPPAPKPVAVAVVAVPEPIAESPPAPPPPVPAVVDEATLSREVSAIEEANETVREGRFDDALTQLGHYADEFPSGALATEAAVVKVIALCGLNRVDEARAIGAKLPTNNPAVRRLEHSCIK